VGKSRSRGEDASAPKTGSRIGGKPAAGAK
jgi:hypothetical protein